MRSYEQRQLIRMALWSHGIFISDTRDLVADLLNHQEIIDTSTFQLVLEHSKEIIDQFQYTGNINVLDGLHGNCELCDHVIKYEFLVQNIHTRKLYIFGSECIVNYVDAGLKSRLAEELKEAKRKVKRQKFQDLIDATRKAMFDNDYSKDFVDSLEFNLHKYNQLTPKQVAALEKVLQKRLKARGLV